MPQSRLPDINSAFVTYRREVLNSYHTANYGNCIGALYAINALLPGGDPTNYRVTISDIEYKEATKFEINAICYHCQAKTLYESVQIFDLLLPIVDSILSGNEYVKVWICSNCDKECNLHDTTFSKTTIQEPHFAHCVPKAPEKKDGLGGRTSYIKNIKNWIMTFLIELEERMGQFREDNWQKGGQSDDLDIDTSDEVNEAEIPQDDTALES